jgi:AraC family transcriptional regulator, transcriptional activator of pobA
MEDIKKYHLHKDDYSKLHFEIQDAKSYFDKNAVPATKPHKHSFYQLIWFKKSGRHYVDYEMREHGENVVFFINPNQIHHFCPDSDNEGVLFHYNEYFMGQFNDNLIKRFSYTIFNEIGETFITLSDKDLGRFNTISTLIQDEILANDKLVKEQVFAFFSSLLFSIERIKQKETPLDIEKSLDFRLAFDFKKLVYDHIDAFWNLEQFCDKLHTNSKKLTFAVKLYLHDTPANVIQQIKILEAKRKLSNKNVPIQAIAYDLGFDQPTYFTKYFKKAVGLTPKEFQAALP